MTFPSLSENEKIHPLLWVILFIILIIAMVPFVKNYKYADNHLNWLNHDYAKNLLISTEEGSVLMTEGGDNQVFGTLYFTYAEKLRPDITPYDQKGNIFKRIYGDMRYIDPTTLTRRMQMVDTHLFAGEEPFYVKIRDRADPYFIPYWQGRRPVYLTWQRPEPWNLNETYYLDTADNAKRDFVKDLGLGDYYYKRYGIMYKVQNIAYNLVDYLELKKDISVSDAQAQFSSWLHRTVDRNFTLEQIAKMQKKGYLRLAGDRVQYIKMYEAPHKADYFDSFLLRWKNVPNAKYWDNLSREIILNYDYQMGEIYREKIGELQDLKTREKRPEILADMDKRIKDNWEKAKGYYNDALLYGEDSLSMLHNLSVVFLRNGIEDMDIRAHELLQKGLKLYEASWGTYSLMFSFLIMDSMKHPENEANNIKELEQYFAQLKHALSLYKSTKGDYQKNEVWKNFSGIENYFGMMKQAPVEKLMQLQKELEIQLQSGTKTIDSMAAQQVISLLYSRGVPFGHQPYITKADQLLEKMIQIKQNDPGFISWAFQIAIQLQRNAQAYQYGKMYDRLMQGKGDFNFYYTLGMLSYQLGQKADAKVYMNRFLSLVQDDRKNMLQLRDYIEQAKKILATL